VKLTNRIKQSILLLCILSVAYSADAQVSSSSEVQAERARQELEKKGIAEDEVKSRLLKKGIDLDNLKPEQLADLEENIQLVVTELEAEKNDTASGAFVDATTTLTTSVDSLLEKELKENVSDNTEGISQDMQDGASLEEALSNDLSEKLSKKYTVKTNIFGHHIFYDKSIELFKTTSSSTTPNTYVLDVGDKIAINIFGISQADLVYEIEEDGFIRPSGMYKIYLKGITIAKGKVLLKNRFAQAFMFTDGQFNVDLHTARTINVNLFGEVNQPGSYTISALNTALNAIIAAGGITSEAGIRNIRIVSNGKERILDVYDFVADPKVIYDYYLRDNDIIYVSKWKKLITANGAGFKNKGRFELLENEGIKDLLIYTQGLHSKAYTSVIQYTTYEGEQQILKNYTLDEMMNGTISLQDGDVITINTSAIAYDNFVQINGAVRHPGRYEFKEGDKVLNLLELAYLEEETFSKLAYLRRKNTDGTFKLIRLYVAEIIASPTSEYNIVLQKEDVISLYGKASFVDKYDFNIGGAVRSPNKYFYDPEDNITIYDAIMMSKGLKANATEFGYIIGAPTDNTLQREYTVINLSEIMSDPSSASNIKIKPKDRIVIPAKEQYMEQFTVSISGSVKKPGEYVYDSTLSVKEMLIMAGGLKMEAASNKVDVFRLRVTDNEATETYATTLILDHNLDPFNDNIDLSLQPYDHIVVRTTPDFGPIKYVNIKGAVKFPGLYAIMEKNDNISSLVERSGGFTVEALPEAAVFDRKDENIGRLITRIDKAMKGCKRYDLVLKPGDEIFIPKTIDIVKLDKKGTKADDVYTKEIVDGQEKLNLVVNYSNRRAGWYVRKFAGGFNRKITRTGRTVVIHPNGEVKRTVNLIVFKIYPKVRRGSEIKLTLKTKVQKRIKAEKENKEREEKGLPEIVKPEKEKMTVTERLMALQAIMTVATSTVTTAITSLLLIRQL
jgi:protein involved in polysaccharide export with SLBB domain